MAFHSTRYGLELCFKFEMGRALIKLLFLIWKKGSFKESLLGKTFEVFVLCKFVMASDYYFPTVKGHLELLHWSLWPRCGFCSLCSNQGILELECTVEANLLLCADLPRLRELGQVFFFMACRVENAIVFLASLALPSLIGDLDLFLRIHISFFSICIIVGGINLCAYRNCFWSCLLSVLSTYIILADNFVLIVN